MHGYALITVIPFITSASLINHTNQQDFDFTFFSAGPLPPPVLAFNDMSFSYSGKMDDLIYRNLEFGVDTESRIALVGPNGAGNKF